MKPLLLGIFSKAKTQKDIVKIIVDEFHADVKDVDKYKFIICYVDYGDYEGTGWILMKDKETGALYENHSGHCSCYGNEGQFTPEPTHLKYLKSSNFSCYTYGNENEQIREKIKTLKHSKVVANVTN